MRVWAIAVYEPGKRPKWEESFDNKYLAFRYKKDAAEKYRELKEWAVDYGDPIRFRVVPIDLPDPPQEPGG